jgi:hypothetical protein
MPKKFISCVKKVKKKYPKGEYNPYAVCRVSTGYYGTTHEIGMIHKKKK